MGPTVQHHWQDDIRSCSTLFKCYKLICTKHGKNVSSLLIIHHREHTHEHKLRINHKLVALCVTVLLQRRHSHFADELDSNKCSNGHECWTDKHDVVVQCWFNLAPSKLIQAQRGHQPTHMHVKTHTQSHRAGLCTVRWHNTVHQRMHWTCCVAIWWCLGKLRPQDHTGCSYASNLNAHCTLIAFRDLEYLQPK